MPYLAQRFSCLFLFSSTSISKALLVLIVRALASWPGLGSVQIL